MSGPELHWAEARRAAAADAALADAARGGALLLADAAGGLAGADAAGRALLAANPLPEATRRRLRALAGGVASPTQLRLERLRLSGGHAAIPATVGCKLVGGILAVALSSAEFRKLKITVPPPEPEPEASADPAPPRRGVARMIWQSDAEGRLVHFEPEPAALIGGASALGRRWADLVGDGLHDLDGGLLDKLAGGATWSGHGVLWHGADPASGFRLELSGVPLLDAERRPAGFRGFALLRPGAAEPWPASATATAAERAPDDAPPPKDAAAPEDHQDGPASAASAAEAAAEAVAGPIGLAAAAAAIAAHETTEAIADAAPSEAGDASEHGPSPAEAAAGSDPAAPADSTTEVIGDEGSETALPEDAEPAVLDEEAAVAAFAEAAEAPALDEVLSAPRALPASERSEADETDPSPASAVTAEPEPEDAAQEISEAPDAAMLVTAAAASSEAATPDEPVSEASGEDETSAEEPASEATAGDEAAPEDEAVAEAPIAAAETEADPEPRTTQEPVAEAADAKASGPAESPAPPRAAKAPDSDNIVPLRNGHLTSVRPVLEPSKNHLSSAERNAFREIAKALGARIAGEGDAGPRLPPVAPLTLRTPEQGEAERAADPAAPAAAPPQRARQSNSHADLLDRLPVAVLVSRGETTLYANRTLLDLLDYADLDDLAAGGGVSRLIRTAQRTDGGPMVLLDRGGASIKVDAVLSSLSWQNEPATMMAFRSRGGGAPMTEEDEEAEALAAEFEAEEQESAARVEALRLDVDVREARIAELVAMLDTATDGVVTVDERGRILSLNKAAEALFGYDQREVTGELFTLLLAAESHAPGLDYLEGLKGGGVASVMNDGREVVGRVRQGGRIPLFMTMGQIAHGQERRFCAVLRDITAWKKAEGELVEARKIAEKASAQKSDVLAKISHEIRTPLNAIIGFAEVMAEERFGPIANERYKEYLRDIHQSGGYVISLVNDLLDLAKIEAGKLDLDFVGVNLNELAASAVALLQPEAQRGRVVLRTGFAPKLPPVVADQRSIRQILINLLSNAVKFTDAGGQVIVSTALGDQGEAILRVRDTGIGMDDKELALALEPFRQVPTTRKAGGTGLGLPLTKALVEANRAQMSITSVKKEGTLVEIAFPPQRVLAS